VSESVIQDAYTPVNANQYIGDVLQSGYKFNEKYYWCVNNSGKIVITDKDMHKLSTITGLISPRYIAFVSNSKAYVSNLQLNNNAANYIQVIDLNTNTISKSIRLDGWTEEMVQSYGNVYVCNQRKKYLYVIDAANDIVSDSIPLNATSACIVKDQSEKLWVSCNSDATNNINARLVRINPVSKTIEADLSLQTTQASVSRLHVNGDGSNLYFLLNDLYRMPVSSLSVPSAALVLQNNQQFYGFCIDPSDETIYVSDAIDFIQNGSILRYKPDGTYLGSFKAGVAPGYMWIEE
jgi:DNA-binding beta-propeller fold protein YncE